MTTHWTDYLGGYDVSAEDIIEAARSEGKTLEQWCTDTYEAIYPEGERAEDFDAADIARQITRSAAATALGSARTDRKAQAARQNGKRGGRPRK